MKYLLINHVPFARGSREGTYRIGDMWIEDLRAQARAIHSVGGSLTIATPLVDEFTRPEGGFRSVEVIPGDELFQYVPLPHYLSLKRYLAERSRLHECLSKAVTRASIVQADTGGHPFALGQIVWPIARRLGRKRIWLFDGSDPFPRMELAVVQEKNPAKRIARRLLVSRFASFCSAAIRDADLVFAHNDSVVQRFRNEWNDRCHLFDRSLVTEALLISKASLAERQAKLRDTSSPLKLVVAGRQIRIKATDHVLRAIAIARTRGADIRLDVLGEGNDLEGFRLLAGELGLGGDVVRFLGSVSYGEPLFDVWASAHVMVVTNLTAEISRNVLLGLARGLPLISYRNPGTDAMLERAKAAVLVPNGDVEALSGAFVNAYNDRGHLVELAANGLALARTGTLEATHRRRAELARDCVGETVSGQRADLATMDI